MMENINLIRKIAWSFHRTTGHDWDDLFQEAALAYLEALHRYDPTKGNNLSTFMWSHISKSLTNYLRLYEKRTGHIYSIEEHPIDPIGTYTPLFEKMTDEAEQIATIILNSPEQFDILPPRFSILFLMYKLRCLGWSWDEIWKGIRDLKSAFS